MVLKCCVSSSSVMLCGRSPTYSAQAPPLDVAVADKLELVFELLGCGSCPAKALAGVSVPPRVKQGVDGLDGFGETGASETAGWSSVWAPYVMAC
jgi:hypothetical protein